MDIISKEYQGSPISCLFLFHVTGSNYFVPHTSFAIRLVKAVLRPGSDREMTILDDWELMVSN